MGTHIIESGQSRDARRVMDSLRRIVQTIRVASRAAERDFGLSAAQLFVLQRLGEAGSASVNELADRTLTHQSSVSVVVHRLVEKGLVHRTASPADARRAELSLTAAGRSLIHKSPQAAQDYLINAVERLEPRRQGMLAGLLEEIAGEAAAPQMPPPLFFEETKHHKGRKRRHDSQQH